MQAPPKGIKLKRAERILEIDWDGGPPARVPIRALRLACQCAGCVDEFTRAPLLNPATVSEDITISAMDLVGNYAIRFTFSDGHDTGIYSWDRMVQLSAVHDRR
jgi:DUF971 family protein